VSRRPTHPFDERTVYGPNAKGFVHRKDGWAATPSGGWYAAGGFSSDEHGGTHLDAPIHFARGRRTVDAIPVAKLICPALAVEFRIVHRWDRGDSA